MTMHIEQRRESPFESRRWKAPWRGRIEPPHTIVMYKILRASEVVNDSSGSANLGASLSRDGHFLREDKKFELLGALVAKTKPARIINSDSRAN